MLGKVSIVIDAALAGFESDMGRAARITEKEGRRMERQAKQLEASFKAAGKAVGVAVVAGATAAVVALKSTINAMDEMSKAAQRAQMPTEDFSRLAYAGKLADVSLHDLTTSVGRLAKAQGDAQRGLATQIDSFKRLGVEFANADGSLRKTRDVFRDFADAFQRHKGSPEVMAAGMQIFGRSFQKLIPLLKDGREGLEAAADEADRLGITLSTQAGQQAEQFNDNVTRLQVAVSGLWQEVANQLLPNLIQLTDEFSESAGKGDTLRDVATGIADAFKLVGEQARAAVVDLGTLGRDFDILKNLLGGLKDMAVSTFAAIQAVFSMDAGALNRAVSTYADALDRVRVAATNDGTVAYNAALGRDFQGVTSGTARSSSRWSGVSGSVSGTWMPKPPAAPANGSPAAQANARREAVVALSEAERALAQQEEEWAAIQQVWDEAAVDRHNREIDAWAATSEAVKTATSEMTIYAEQAGRNMQDAFAEFLYDPFKDGLDGMLEAFADTLRRMMAEWAASQIAKSIGEWGEANSGAGGFWGAAAQWAGSFFGGGRAIGGKVSQGRIYEVTEGGRPELLESGGRTYLMPGSDGTVIPAGTSSAGAVASTAGGYGNVIIHNNTGGEARTEEQMNPNGGRDLLVFIENAARSAIGKDFASGGGVARIGAQAYGWQRQPQVRG